MNQRERQPSEGASQAVARSASGPAYSAPSTKTPLGAPSWEAVFGSASAEQQAQLLALARRQGILYGHQLPPLSNGFPGDHVRSFLSRVLGGKLDNLAPLRALPLDVPSLNPGQREAVAKALATPDICLIQGLPVTGKSRVAAEIAGRAAERGERVLFVAPLAASVDRILQLLQNNEFVYAVRHAAPDESLTELPATSRALLFAERVRREHAHATQAATRARADAEQQHAGLVADALLWPYLLELAEGHERLGQQSEAVARLHQAVPDAVAAVVARLLVNLDRKGAELLQAGLAPSSADQPFEAAVAAGAQAFAQTQVALDQTLAELNGRMGASREQLARLNAEQDALAPLAEAKAGRRWWTRAWWRATLHGNILARAADLQAQVRAAQEQLGQLESESARLLARRRQTEENERAERALRVDREIARRRDELDVQANALVRERDLVEAKWRQTLARLHPETRRPTALTVQAVREARAAWQRNVDTTAKRSEFAAHWLEQLLQHPDLLAEKLRACANVVAAPLRAAVAEFAPGAAPGEVPVLFDLLIVDHAEQLLESEFVAVAQRCRRWVLIAESCSGGEGGPHPPPEPAPERHQVKSGVERRKRHPAGPNFFQQLWAALHCNPSRLPYVWLREADARLCCRLRPVSAEQRRWIETERVADFPDVELRIVAPPRHAPGGSEPFLAEVVFPPMMSVLDAKSYIFRELDEVPIRARTERLHWVDLPERLVLTLADGNEPVYRTAAVPLSGGVRELLATSVNGDRTWGDAWFTKAVEFERAAGWERARAEDWTRRHLGLRDLGRTARLDAPQGIAPGVARLLGDVLFAGSYRFADTDEAKPPRAPVEFVPVPPLPRVRRGDHHRPRVPSGAGLEIDLADMRQRERLPDAVRARLADGPGIVNCLEAQAVVRALTRLAREQAAGPADSRGNDALPASQVGAARRTVGVVALDQAQAQLIRALLQPESDLLTSAGLDVLVDVPSAVREREFDIACVSLTRSHTHRAVSFGPGPDGLITALTRGRSRLLIFGDAGTLARRADWKSPLHPLDESASARERAIVARLVRYLAGDGRYPELFHIRHESANAGRSISIRGAAAREGSNA